MIARHRVALVSFQNPRIYLCSRLYQLTCFLATYEHGSLGRRRGARLCPALGLRADRSLEKSLGVQLFRRVGRGVVPTTVADSLRPHAEKVLAAVDDAQEAVRSVRSLETGTIRFGMFGTARLYAGAGLVADVLSRYPGVRVEAHRPNSTDVQEDLRRGRIEGRDDRRTDRRQRGACR